MDLRSVFEVRGAGGPILYAKCRSMRILIVDDDPVQRQMAAVALGLGGHKVVPAEGGAQALRLLEAERFDAALFDHEMPGMSGLELLLNIRKRRLLDSMPVMFATSRDDLAVIDRAFELGASGFVVKPVNWALMLHQLRFVVRAAENERTASEARDSAIKLAETKDQLLNIARHELRTPLHAVIGFGRIIRDSLEDGAELRASADDMLQAADRLNSRVSDMMSCLDLASGRIVPSLAVENPGWIVEDNLALWKRKAAERGVEIIVDNTAPDAKISVDPLHLANLFSRLIDNSIDHGRVTKVVSVSIRPMNEGALDMSIADDGAGISPDRLKQCQEAFAQGDMTPTREGEGLGLGLHIVQGMAKLNNLGFALTSPGLGKGTLATLTARLAA